MSKTITKTPTNAITDKDRLDWLERHEAHLVSHREKNFEGGYCIFWNVVKRRKSISGHPLGSPRTAIDAAIAASGEKIGTGTETKTCGDCAAFRNRRCKFDIVSGATATDIGCAYWQSKPAKA